MRYAYNSGLIQGSNPVTVRDESINCTSAVITSDQKLVIGGQEIEPWKPVPFNMPAGEFDIQSPDGPASISIIWLGETVAEKTVTLDQELSKVPEPKEAPKEETKPTKKPKQTDPPEESK